MLFGNEASNRVVRGSRQVSMNEMRKRKQTHEKCQADVMDINSCQKDVGNGEVAIWEVMTWSEEWTGRDKCRYGAESVRDMRGKEWEEGRVPAKEAKNWRIEGEKKRITRKEYKRLLKVFLKWKA